MNMWYFTGKGDQGDSSLYEGRRISKGEVVFELIGTLDEANAHLGMAVSLCKTPEIKTDLRDIQNHLSKLMSFIACIKEPELEDNFSLINATDWLEAKIHEFGKFVKNPRAFINTGETTFGAAIDISRTVIRRAERISVRHFGIGEDGRKEVLTYLNRLSSFLYILRLFAEKSID